MSENFMLGLTLMAIGMGTVLAFLCILIASMRIMSKIVLYLNEIFPEKIEVTNTNTNKKVASNSDDEAIAVALAAIMARK